MTVATDEPGANTKGPYWVRAVDRTVQLLEVIADDAGAGRRSRRSHVVPACPSRAPCAISRRW